jgi:hypothetical protein
MLTMSGHKEMQIKTTLRDSYHQNTTNKFCFMSFSVAFNMEYSLILFSLSPLNSLEGQGISSETNTSFVQEKQKQKHHHQQTLVRMSGKRNPHTLLVGMQASATTLESHMEAP